METNSHADRFAGWGGFAISLVAVLAVAAASYRVGCAYSESVLDPIFRTGSYRQYVRPVYMTLGLAPVFGCVAILAHLFRSRLFLLAGLHCLFTGPIIHYLTSYLGIFQIKMRVTWARGAPVALYEALAESTTYQGIAIVALIITSLRWKQFPAEKLGVWRIGTWDVTKFVSLNASVATLWLLTSIVGRLGVYAWLTFVTYRLIRSSSIRQTNDSKFQLSIHSLFATMTLIAVMIAYHSKFYHFWDFWLYY
jgi:hypothetical protein